MDKLTLSVSHWCSLKDGIQSGSCLPLTSEHHQRIDEAVVLAGKKLRNVDPQTVQMLCCFAALRQTTSYEPHAAMVSATSMGAFDSVCKLLVESWQNALPHQVSPGNIPNTVINSTAGIAAIHYNFDGPNISLCASELSFYEALTKAFALKQRGQAKDIFVSTLESWEGIYGRALNGLRHTSTHALFPRQCYATLFMLADQPQASAQILAVTSGRLLQRELLPDLLTDFLSGHSVANDEIEYVNMWDAGEPCTALATQFPQSELTALPTSARVLMSGLGAWQFEQLLTRTHPGKLALQLAIDAEGFYGISIMQKAAS